jgi:hypothetical protein
VQTEGSLTETDTHPTHANRPATTAYLIVFIFMNLSIFHSETMNSTNAPIIAKPDTTIQKISKGRLLVLPAI